MKPYIIILIVAINVLLCIATSCREDDCHQSILFKNNLTDKTVYIHGNDNHPDTANFKNSFPNPISQKRCKVESYSENKSGLQSRSCYEDRFGSVIMPSGILMVYVFDEEVLATVPWDTIGKYYMVLQRYDLTLENLQELDWYISYPPDERMRHVSMWPPYESFGE